MSIRSGDQLDGPKDGPDRLRARAIEAALNEHPSVTEAAVLCREDVEGQQRLVAYVVPAGPFSPEGLQAHLQETRPGLPLPDAYVPVSTLPLCDTGEFDARRLASFAVIDDELAERWKQVLKQADGVDQVEVIAKEFSRRAAHVHLSDLLPEARPVSVQTDLPTPAELASEETTGKGPLSSAPSVSDGGPLEMPPDAPATLGAALARAAERQPENGIVYVEPDGSTTEQSYPELLDEAACVLGGLRRLGLGPGDKVLFQLDANREFLAAFWGCILGGMVPVPVSIAPVYEPTGAVVQKLSSAWRMLDKPLILAGNSLAPAIASVLDDLDLKSARVQTLKQLRPAEPARDWHAGEPDDLTLLLLTSGSTGIPKAVMHSHRTLLSRSAGVVRFNRFTSDDVSLNWMPLDHVGGIVMFHLRDVVAGGRQIHVPTERILQAPLEWLDLIDRHRATITWAPNFAFGLINGQCAEVARRRWDLSSMRFILNAGEAIVAKTARRFLEILAPHGLPPTSMKPAWGMSETSSAVTYSDRFTLETTNDDDRFVEVGQPTAGISLRIVDESNRVVSEGTTGHLQIRGATVTLGYYRNPEVNRKAFTDDGWFVTGDLGTVRDGALTITGRAKDEIIINGVNYIGSEIETVVEAVEGVETSFTAACAVRTPGEDTDGLAIFFNARSSDEDSLPGLVESIRMKVGSDIGIMPSHLIPVDKGRIPKTAIGKIQRRQLKQRFQDGEFDATLKRIDVLTEAANTMPDWFFRKAWFRKEPQAYGASEGDSPIFPTGKLGQSPSSLVFADRAGLAASVCEQLRQAGQSFVVVETGESFAKLGPRRYRIDPEDRDGYRELMASIFESGERVDQILHLWTYAESAETVDGIESLRQAQYQGLFSLLFLVQALVAVQGEGQPVRLHVFGSHTQITSPDDTCTFKHSTVIGLLKTIPLEMPWLSCRHTDLEVDGVEANAERVLRELQIVNSEEEVAYRGGRRLVWGLSQVDLRRCEPKGVPLKQGGIYLITGGLGGIGSSLARFLVKEYQAKLVLIGMTRLPDRTEWPACLERGGKLAQRVRAYREIEALGQDFFYQPVDVSDLPALEKVVATAESRWNDRLAGVFHLASAGDPSTHWNQMDRFRVSNQPVQVFDDMFRSKVYGTWALHQLIEGRPQATLVSFSSAIALFGGATFSAYAAAQTFMNCYSLRERHRGHPGSYCFAWGAWDGIGRSKGDPDFAKDAYRSAGYYMIREKQGFDSLIAALYRDQPDLIIGLDGGNRNVGRHLHEDPHHLRQLVAYYTTGDTRSSAPDFPQPELKDRFGSASRCELRRLAHIPLTDEGEIDRQSLLAAEESRRKTVPPRNESERRIAAIWQEVLGVRQVGVHDAFLQLGGNSLGATQVLSRVAGAFHVRVSLREFFGNATVAQLAALVDRQADQPAGQHGDETIRRTDPESLLDDMDNMTDEQIAALLAKTQEREDTQ